MMIYYLAAVGSVLLTCVAQIILKKGSAAANNSKNGLMSFFNISSIIAYVLFTLVTLLNLFALKQVMVKEMAMILPITYVVIPLLSYFFLNEKITNKQIQGIGIIIIGIIIFNFNSLLN